MDHDDDDGGSSAGGWRRRRRERHTHTENTTRLDVVVAGLWPIIVVVVAVVVVWDGCSSSRPGSHCTQKRCYITDERAVLFSADAEKTPLTLMQHRARAQNHIIHTQRSCNRIHLSLPPAERVKQQQHPCPTGSCT